MATPSFAQSQFSDLKGHWAQNCILTLANGQIMTGFEDGTFRPDDPVTRAQFAYAISKAFPNVEPVREAVTFTDIPTDYWAADAIRAAYRGGFLSGYSGSLFNPSQKIQRLQALAALATGLKYSPTQDSGEILRKFLADWDSVPKNARTGIAAGIEKRIVVNYPDPTILNANKTTTRADAASFICQALLKPGEADLVPVQYIAGVPAPPPTQAQPPTQPQPAPAPQPGTQPAPPGTQPAPPATQPAPVAQALKPQAVTLEAGNLFAEFSYLPQANSTMAKDLRLKIVRAGKTLLDEPVLLPKRSPAASPDSDPPPEQVSEGQFVGLVVRDLDGDGEAEVMAELMGDGGKNCCAYSLIYRYDPKSKEYSHIKHLWGNVTHELKDLDRDGIPEFESFDGRFASALDIPYAYTAFPLRLWQYQKGEMLDYTREYPDLVYSHATALWQTYQQRRSKNEEVRGVLAAYLADKYSLGQAADGWNRVQQVYQGSDREEYFALLRKLLPSLGYSEK